jgi:hypothetical protein
VLGGEALDKIDSFVGKIPSQAARAVDAAREKLRVEPPISNYRKGRPEDSAYNVEAPNTSGYTLQHYDPRTIPPEFGMGEGSIFHGNRVVGTPVAWGAKPPARQPELVVSAYRADPTNKYGGGKGVETLPTKLSGADLYSKARDMSAARTLGVPQLSASQLATLALKEGRPDFGTNGSSDKATNDLVKRYTDAGVPFDNATFMAQLKIKQDTAARLGIPFEEAWSGRDYASDAGSQASAALLPPNKALMEIIQKGIDDGSKYPVVPVDAPVRRFGFAQPAAQ